MTNKKALFKTLVDCVPRFDAHGSQYFTKFYRFVMLMNHLDTNISDFCANDDMTDYFTLCACARVIMDNLSSRKDQEYSRLEIGSTKAIGGNLVYCIQLEGGWLPILPSDPGSLY